MLAVVRFVQMDPEDTKSNHEMISTLKSELAALQFKRDRLISEVSVNAVLVLYDVLRFRFSCFNSKKKNLYPSLHSYRTLKDNCVPEIKEQ